MYKYRKTLGGVILLALLLGGCGGKAETPPGNNGEESPPPAVSSEVKPVATVEEDSEKTKEPSSAPSKEVPPLEEWVNPEGYALSPKEAVEIFQEKFPGAQLTKVSLQRGLQGFQYKVKGQDAKEEHTVKVDAQTAEVLEEETEPRDDEETFVFEDSFKDWKDLYHTVVNKVGVTASVKEWELTVEDGRLVYIFDTVNEGQDKEVLVDPRSGEIVGVDD